MDKLISFPTPRAYRRYPDLLREVASASPASDLDETLAQPKSSSAAEDPLLCQVEMPLRGVFYPLGFAFEIVTNSHAVLDAAAQSWAHAKPRESAPALQLRIGVTGRTAGKCLPCPPCPVVRGQEHLLSIVADAHNQAMCDLKAGSAFAWLTHDALQYPDYARYHFLEAVALTLIAASRATPVHAACVSRHGHGMLLCGPSGAGKSTLAYACARKGWIFTSDDSSYLKHDADELRIVGNSHQLRFRPSAREIFPELRGRGITPRAEGKPSIEVPTGELPGIVTAEEASIHSIILLNRWPSTRAELLPLPSEAAQRLFQQSLLLPEMIKVQQTQRLRYLSRAAVYELRYHDLQQAIERLDLLARERGQAR